MNSSWKKPKFDVVLSGSGINYPIHIGALSALEEYVDINTITAVSGGALVGAHYALHQSIKKLRYIYKTYDMSQLISKRFSLMALISGYLYSTRKLDEVIKQEFGNARLFDTKIPVNVIATDMHTHNLVVFSSFDGYHNASSLLLRDAVRASMAAPTLFKPHLKLFDGGVVNNMPIDWAAENINLPGIGLIGIKVVSPKPKGRSSQIKGPFRLVSILRVTINTFMVALDREHIEENTDKIVFVKSFWPSFNFTVSKSAMEKLFWLGRYKTLLKLKENWGLTIPDDVIDEARHVYQTTPTYA